MSLSKKNALILACATLAGMAVAPQCSLAQTTDYYAVIPQVHNVMTGNSSVGSDQVWFRAVGQPANIPSQCVSGGMSVFYLSKDGSIDAQKAMALLMTAQVSGIPVQVEFDLAASQADFWGYGITQCVVYRIVLGS